MMADDSNEYFDFTDFMKTQSGEIQVLGVPNTSFGDQKQPHVASPFSAQQAQSLQLPFSTPSTQSKLMASSGKQKDKRGHVKNTTSDLPPIEQLRAESLKNYSREQLRYWLQQNGVQNIGSSKPDLKRQMRELLLQKGIISDPKLGKQRHLGVGASVPGAPGFSGQPTTPPEAGMSPNRQLALKGELPKCISCTKKANKDCSGRRCRSCCLRAIREGDEGYACPVHSKGKISRDFFFYSGRCGGS